MKIFLIGLPGSGKTTLGKVVAELLKRPFVDLDEEIVMGERQSIAEIFVKMGEDHFRKIETKYLARFCGSSSDFIMATGGGTPCFFSNLELINKSGTSIFLDASVDEIARRMMQTELAKRPMFSSQDVGSIAERVKSMWAQRISFYQKAHLTVSGDQIDSNYLTKTIAALEG